VTGTVLRAYYSVLKPERTYANVMTTAAGFLLACEWHIDWQLFITTILGTTLIVASACAANNCTDRSIDARMPRTKKRALVVHSIPVRSVAILAAILGIAGFVVLAAYVNWLTVLVGAIGYLDYVVFYAWSKRHSVHSTLIGTISGATPVVAGYTAVTGQFDLTALLLALILIFWQMSHFFAIGIFRRADYAAANLPIWPVKKGIQNTKNWIITYTILFMIASLGLFLNGDVGNMYLAFMTALGVTWLYVGLKAFKTADATRWARQMFFFSLIVILGTSVMLSVSPLLA
jgi:protoheme IX farnesyltransferase